MMYKTQTPEKTGANSVRTNFPFRLHYLLSHAKQLGVDDTLEWHPSGEKFVIYNQEKFTAKILPNVFKQTKFASFRRQLNAYGFERETKPNNSPTNSEDSFMVYSHKDFLKSDPIGCRHIPRRRTNQILLEGLSRIGADKSFLETLNEAKGKNQATAGTQQELSQEKSIMAVDNPAKISSLFEKHLEASKGESKPTLTNNMATPEEVRSSRRAESDEKTLSKLNQIVIAQDARTKSRVATYLCQLSNTKRGPESNSMMRRFSVTSYSSNNNDDDKMSDSVLDELAAATVDINMTEPECCTIDMILWDPRQECLNMDPRRECLNRDSKQECLNKRNCLNSRAA